tara:strand:- start:9081 stop:10223 length:1143 start_codon:yes stop_codon:yes gene_type:complete
MSISSLNRDFYYYTEPIGRGSFSTVYKGYHYYNKSVIAIKKFTKIPDKEYFKNEIALMKQLHHKNVLKLHKVLKHKSYSYLILEYCDSNLYSYIESNNNSFNYKYFTGIINGLEYLYSSNILHRDIKPHNILIKNNTIKISDFGFAKTFEKNQLITTFCGSPLYMAPEIIKNRKYNNNSDIWSLGVVLYELITKIHPYTIDSRRELWEMIHNDSIIIDYSFIENGLISAFIKHMLVVEPVNRISWELLFEKYRILNLQATYKNIDDSSSTISDDILDNTLVGDLNKTSTDIHDPDDYRIKERSSSISIINNKRRPDNYSCYSAPNNLTHSYMKNYIKHTLDNSPENNDIPIIGISPNISSPFSSYLGKPYELFKSFFHKK